MTTLRRNGLGLLLASAVLGSSPAQAQIGGLLPSPDNPPTRQGTRGGNFLHIGIGAVGNAMAGAVGSSVSGPLSWYWNPAGASSSETFAGVAGRQNLYGDLDLRQTYAAISVPVLGGTFGLNLNTLNSGDIQKTTESNPFGNTQAGLTYEWVSTAMGMGYARRITDRLSAGGQIKYITEGITNAHNNWIAFDIGTQFHTGIYGLQLGATLLQLGGGSRTTGPLLNQIFNDANVNQEQQRTNLYTQITELPTGFRFSVGNDLFGTAESLLGGAGSPHHLFVEFAANDAVDLATQYAGGLEYGFRNTLFLRGGKKMYNDDRDIGTSSGKYGLSGGFGLRLGVLGRDTRFDYSFTSLGDLKDIQVFSFAIGR